MSSLRTDIFPNFVSEDVEPLSFPDFRYISSQFEVICFVIYVSLEDRIYYKKCDTDRKKLKHLKDIGKDILMYHSPKTPKTWSQAAATFQIPMDDVVRSQQSNDLRVGFLYNRNCFVVKPYFTFGVRKVHSGTVHVIQTLQVPLFFYYVKPSNRCKVTLIEKSFVGIQESLFKRKWIQAHSAYKIPPGTHYVLYTFHKTLFSLHIVDEHVELPFPSSPIFSAAPKPPKETSYDVPVQTPYILDTLRDPETRMPPPAAGQDSTQTCHPSTSQEGRKKHRRRTASSHSPPAMERQPDTLLQRKGNTQDEAPVQTPYIGDVEREPERRMALPAVQIR